MTPLTAIFQLFHGLVLAAFVVAMPGSVRPDVMDAVVYARGLHRAELVTAGSDTADNPLLDFRDDESPAVLDPEPAGIDSEEETTDGTWTIKQSMPVVEPVMDSACRGAGHLAYQVAGLVAAGRPRAPPHA